MSKLQFSWAVQGLYERKMTEKSLESRKEKIYSCSGDWKCILLSEGTYRGSNQGPFELDDKEVTRGGGEDTLHTAEGNAK